MFRLWLLLWLPLLAAAEPESVAPLSPLSPCKVNLVVCGLPRVASLGYQMAIDKGFYRCRGLDVAVVYQDRDASCLPGGVENNGDFIAAPLLLALKWRADGSLQLLNLAQVVQRSTQVLVGWRCKGVFRPENFDERRIALPPGTQRLSALVFFEQLKIKPTILGLSERGGIELFAKKRIEGMQCSDYLGLPQLYLYGIDKEELVVISWRQDVSLDIPEDGLYCQEYLWNKRPDICQAMRAATQEGWRYVAAHPDEAAAALLKHCQKAKEPMNQVQAEMIVRALVPALTPADKPSQHTGDLAPIALQRALEFLIGQKMIPAETEIGIADFCRRK
jgi:NitT/TauT family transport system substrate-binding protein